jgi:hypothetical protein
LEDDITFLSVKSLLTFKWGCGEEFTSCPLDGRILTEVTIYEDILAATFEKYKLL